MSASEFSDRKTEHFDRKCGTSCQDRLFEWDPPGNALKLLVR
jgi:hypothetical protein